jgi:hypothetical protein
VPEPDKNIAETRTEDVVETSHAGTIDEKHGAIVTPVLNVDRAKRLSCDRLPA